MQAKRQMGSAFKPLVYAAALDHPDKVYTPATILLDAPITMHREGVDDATPDPTNSDLWKPSNYDRDYLGEITLRKALYMSRNTVAVKVLTDIGVGYAYDYVKKLGIESPLNRDTSMVLGTSSVTMLEMCRAYSAFAAGGAIVEPVFIEKVVDRDGKVLEQRPAAPVKTQVMPASTAYIMTSMLQDVVRQGTATRALELGKTTAGKTGTTNDFFDASYYGYTPQLVTGTWIGYDQPRSMGYGQTGGDTALPMWVEYMKAALKVYPHTDYKVPEEVEFAVVDEQTGRLANEETKRRVRVPFQKGEAPTDALEPGQVGTEDFLAEDHGQ
jgi:penicillin-binding protein 1A